MKIALLGAESTGKTRLARDLAAHLSGQHQSVLVVTEVLREWCEREGRTPRPDEQMPIAQEQERRVDAAAAQANWVIADTTALMVAIYSAMLFDDSALYNFALQRQRSYDLTLVTGLDLPWVADGLQRVGPQVREPVDALVRAALTRAGVSYQVVYGQGEERLANALIAMNSIAISAGYTGATGLISLKNQPWTWSCDKCSDPDCERHLFTSKMGKTR
ncbi:AAA family ATPase [Polaromonas sp. UC242_47]|uniref:AAA family ATPase n=1 Tax=Polaromonas sp. UC242_47 TaxID=3374626 RepID=UPI0037A781CA